MLDFHKSEKLDNSYLLNHFSNKISLSIANSSYTSSSDQQIMSPFCKGSCSAKLEGFKSSPTLWVPSFEKGGQFVSFF